MREIRSSGLTRGTKDSPWSLLYRLLAVQSLLGREAYDRDECHFWSRGLTASLGTTDVEPPSIVLHIEATSPSIPWQYQSHKDQGIDVV